jgi:hypothetical protein
MRTDLAIVIECNLDQIFIEFGSRMNDLRLKVADYQNGVHSLTKENLKFQFHNAQRYRLL